MKNTMAIQKMDGMCRVLLSMIFLLGASKMAIGQIPLLEAEQQAFKAAVAYAESSVVQIESFGGADVVAGEQVPVGAATGTIVEPGWVVTSTFHFRSQPVAITVIFGNGKRLPATLVARDHSRELAILKIDGDWDSVKEVAHAATLSPVDSWNIGAWVIALGKTFDPAHASRSVGILSARGRVFDKAIQTDAKVSPYNYGGPIIDIQGRVMGILTILNPGIATEGEAAQWYDGGVGFAIPLADILKRLPQWKEGQDTFSGKIGIRPTSPDEYGEPIVLAGVTPGSPAAKAGLRSGDILKSINGQLTPRLVDMRHALGPRDAGETVEVVVTRGTESVQAKCLLVKEVPAYREPYFGFIPKIEVDPTMVNIGAILPDSPAVAAGLKVGQIIVSINEQAVATPGELRNALQFLDYREPVRMTIREEDGKSVNKTIQPKPWPKEIAADIPKLTYPVINANERPSFQNIPLGDVTNKAFAIVPPDYQAALEYGLMIVLPEAGDVNSKVWVDGWDAFAREHRWIVAVVSTSASKQWSIQDLDVIQKVRTQLITDYHIDPRRTVLGGVGSGGSLALVMGFQDRTRLRGIWTLESRIPSSSRIPPCEPQESIHLMMVGMRPELAKFGEAITKLGYPFSSLAQKVDPSQPTQGAFVLPLQRWLRRLEAY